MIEVVEKRNNNKVTNRIHLEFAALSDNESFARMTVAAFITPLNPTLEEMSDVKTAISEAVTNAVLHGYESRNSMEDRIYMDCMLRGDVLEVEIAETVSPATPCATISIHPKPKPARPILLSFSWPTQALPEQTIRARSLKATALSYGPATIGNANIPAIYSYLNSRAWLSTTPTSIPMRSISSSDCSPLFPLTRVLTRPVSIPPANQWAA